MPDHRVEFITKWYKRGVAEGDPFDQFFSLWISLIVAAARWGTLQGRSAYDQTDRDKVIQYLAGHKESAAIILNSSPQVRDLARRAGSIRRNPILDTGSQDLRKKLQRFADHYANRLNLEDAELVETLGEILNKVRNNVFHGIKIYDDRDDVRVLKLVNPILREILQACEPDIDD
jgi:hypothetical protein